MRLLLEFLFVSGSLVVLVPGAILLIETVAAWLPASDGQESNAALDPAIRVAVLVPAHDEASQIEETVRSLARDLPANARLIVIADNCRDDTAALAERAGAAVIERTDPDRMGKGFAISFALARLDDDPPDVVILVDADCRVSPAGLATLASTAQRTQCPAQAEYLLTAPAGASSMTLVSALAFLLRNRVRPRGLRRMGLPCHLTGSGMAFPWRLLRDAPATGSNLVEDLVLGIGMALRGTPPLLCPQVQISSELPATRSASLGQRRRWEHGQLHTLATYVPRLLGAGIARGRADLVALGLDLLVPPLALLVTLQFAWLLVTVGAALFGLTSAVSATVAAVGFAAVSAAVGIAWLGFGRQTLPLRQIVFVPLYLLWKIPLYVALALRGKQKKWERTARAHEETKRSPDPSPPAA